MKGRARRIDIRELRTYRATVDALARLPLSLPGYVHKWTRLQQPYLITDLTPPHSLYLYGQPVDDRQPIVSVGGTRSPCVETFVLVSEISRRLARRGCTVVSGGVPGVDLAAHLAAADEPAGRSYAVMSSPAELGLAGHEWQSALADRAIRRRGGFVSEYTEPCPLFGAEHRERLLARDRIISGICDVFLVFECSRDSATIDTAVRALLQGKDVIAIDSSRRTSRDGIEQLCRAHPVLRLSETTMSAGEITSEIEQVVAARQSRAHIALT